MKGVPMPEPEFYSQSSDTRNARDYFIRTYGSTTVMLAEMAVVLDLMVILGIVKPAELAALIERKCKKIDMERRIHAGVPD
jgi:hypothetical protein